MEEDLNQLGEDLVTTSARFLRWISTSEFTMSLALARILGRLSDSGPSRISELAALERCSQPTITNHVKTLEAAKLVERSPDVTDARAWVIQLTDSGRQELAQMRASLGRSVQPSLARLSPRDLQALRAGIDALRRLMAADRLTR